MSGRDFELNSSQKDELRRIFPKKSTVKLRIVTLRTYDLFRWALRVTKDREQLLPVSPGWSVWLDQG